MTSYPFSVSNVVALMRMKAASSTMSIVVMPCLLHAVRAADAGIQDDLARTGESSATRSRSSSASIGVLTDLLAVDDKKSLPRDIVGWNVGAFAALV